MDRANAYTEFKQVRHALTDVVDKSMVSLDELNYLLDRYYEARKAGEGISVSLSEGAEGAVVRTQFDGTLRVNVDGERVITGADSVTFRSGGALTYTTRDE